jgi:2,4-dienoyl-CoA reductase-like NADH-dependent reductase (Old Yellow Enzyme family)
LSSSTDILFQPLTINGLEIPNRIAMAPMTRCFSPDHIPGSNVADYYRRRAEGGVGLIITEGTYIPHAGAWNDTNIPNFHGEAALAGWKKVVDDVHAAGAKIFPQLWHIGLIVAPELEGFYQAKTLEARQVGPSGMTGGMGVRPTKQAEPMTQADIDAVIDAFATAAATAKGLGFDGIELHAAHGYLIDQFFWSATNLRTDRYGGDLVRRTRFACEIVEEIRNRCGPDFVIDLRYSQWKQHDYTATLADTPQELERFLAPLADAGVDVFHASQRRFWECEFGSDMNLAGWTRKLTGKPAISVGSVSLDGDFIAAFDGESSSATGIDQLLEMMNRGDFDMIAVGRALIVDPDWAIKVRAGGSAGFVDYTPRALETLV